MKSIDMLVPQVEEVNEHNDNNELELQLQENSNAINNLIDKLDKSIVIKQVEEQENDNEEREEELENE